MVSRDDIVRQAARRYPDYLRSLVTAGPFFPLPIVLGKSRRARDYEDRKAELAEVRRAAADLGLDMRWALVSDPRFGPHERPLSACFSDESAYLAAIGKTRDTARFRDDLATLLHTFPALRDWAAGNVKTIVARHGEWPRIARVLTWMLRNPATGLYLRQLPIPGVHSKYIESHTSLLDRLLIELDPRRAEPAGASFRHRHGLREEESLIRLRFLDPALREKCGLPAIAAEIALPVSAAARLPLSGCRAIVTENLRNFLALPDLPGAVAVQGNGEAVALLQALPWLHACDIAYWGDIDRRGFAILARFRESFPHARSLLMDTATLQAHRDLTVPDTVSETTESPALLSNEERQSRREATAANLRLEQERIAMPWVEAALERRFDGR